MSLCGDRALPGGEMPPPRALTIAGSDSGGGAGVQADLKTFHAFGVYGASVVTALTAQNTREVRAIEGVPAAFVRCQLEAVLSDIEVSAAKTGMLAAAEVVEVVAAAIERFSVRPLVVDPVMVAKTGAPLLDEQGRAVLAERLVPLAMIVTPNLEEAGLLAGIDVRDRADMAEAARRIHRLGPGYVLVKGGHLKGEAVDVLYDGREVRALEALRLGTGSPHGVGCALSAAIAAALACGTDVPTAVEQAKRFVTAAIDRAYRVGGGHAVLDHWARGS